MARDSPKWKVESFCGSFLVLSIADNDIRTFATESGDDAFEAGFFAYLKGFGSGLVTVWGPMRGETYLFLLHYRYFQWEILHLNRKVILLLEQELIVWLSRVRWRSFRVSQSSGDTLGLSLASDRWRFQCRCAVATIDPVSGDPKVRRRCLEIRKRLISWLKCPKRTHNTLLLTYFGTNYTYPLSFYNEKPIFASNQHHLALHLANKDSGVHLFKQKTVNIEFPLSCLSIVKHRSIIIDRGEKMYVCQRTLQKNKFNG